MASLLALAADKKKSFIDLTNKDRMIKVCNLPPAASKMQICTLFAFFGDIDMTVIYPSDEDLIVLNKVAFIRYVQPESAAGAMHLTNTIYLDRTLIISPVPDEKIPAEETIFYECKRWSASATLETIQIHGAAPVANIQYHMGFAHFPPAPTYDPDLPPLKMSELQRTIYVHNLHNQVKPDALLTLFSGIGEVKYVKIGTVPDCERNYGLVEFTDSGSIPYALQYNDFPLNGINIRTDYALITIDKKQLYRRNRLNRSSSSERSTRHRRGNSPEWVRNQHKDADDKSTKRRSPPKFVEKKKAIEKPKSPEKPRKHYRDKRSKSRDRKKDTRSPKEKDIRSSKEKDSRSPREKYPASKRKNQKMSDSPCPISP